MAIKRNNKGNNAADSYDLEPKTADRKTRRNRRIVKALWAAFLSLGFVIAFMLLLIYNGVIGYMPPIRRHHRARTLFRRSGQPGLYRL